MPDSVLMPCPWCEGGGKPLLHYNKTSFFSFAVRCRECKAQGPGIKFNMEDYQLGRKSWEEFTAPIMEEAKKAWNRWPLNLEKRLTSRMSRPSDAGL